MIRRLIDRHIHWLVNDASAGTIWTIIILLLVLFWTLVGYSIYLIVR